MLHAFNGDTSGAPGGGQERFAYAPSFAFNGPGSPATPAVNGLAALATVDYQHHFYVDSTPTVADVDFARAGVSPSTVASGTFDWHTLLVGGLGKGGQGYYALDITDPTTMSGSETGLASKVLWEFTDPDLGYTFGRPVIAKTREYGWVVIIPSGYNNVNGPVTNQGKGFLYILNAKTGALLAKVTTGVGTATTPSGLGYISGYTIDFADYTVEQIYGGDLLGNVWRFDVSQSSGATYPAPVAIAQLTDPSGAAQPVTAPPQIQVSLDGITR